MAPSAAALIRELERSLPPAQRQAIIRRLEGGANVEGAAGDEAREAKPVGPRAVESPAPAPSAPEGAAEQD